MKYLEICLAVPLQDPIHEITPILLNLKKLELISLAACDGTFSSSQELTQWVSIGLTPIPLYPFLIKSLKRARRTFSVQDHKQQNSLEFSLHGPFIGSREQKQSLKARAHPTSQRQKNHSPTITEAEFSVSMLLKHFEVLNPLQYLANIRNARTQAAFGQMTRDKLRPAPRKILI